MSDDAHMRHALVLGQRGIGRTGRNPSVGCVIVSSDGVIVGRGRTADGGRPHAEAVALAQAGAAAKGATAYVTLEPCASVTLTPACAQSLIGAGVARVVAAMLDPDHRTAGQGFAKLRAAGIEVVTGVREAEARATHAGFLTRLEQHRPFVTLKIAQSADGKTAVAPGADRWITSPEARRAGHLMRAHNDAILVGIETVLADDPDLNCRIAGLEAQSPLRVVLDSNLRMPTTAKLAGPNTLIFTTVSGGDLLKAKGVEIARVARDAHGRIDLAAMLTELAARGITRLLVEGGATVHAAFLNANLADALEIFTAPHALGDKGHGEVAALRDEIAAKFTQTSVRKIGPDVLESYVRKA